MESHLQPDRILARSANNGGCTRKGQTLPQDMHPDPLPSPASHLGTLCSREAYGMRSTHTTRTPLEPLSLRSVRSVTLHMNPDNNNNSNDDVPPARLTH